MPTKKKNEYKETFPGWFAIGSMVKEDRVAKVSVTTKRKGRKKKHAKKV